MSRARLSVSPLRRQSPLLAPAPALVSGQGPRLGIWVNFNLQKQLQFLLLLERGKLINNLDTLAVEELE